MLRWLFYKFHKANLFTVCNPYIEFFSSPKPKELELKYREQYFPAINMWSTKETMFKS